MRLLLALVLVGGLADKACEKVKEQIPDPKPSPVVEPSQPPSPPAEPSPSASADPAPASPSPWPPAIPPTPPPTPPPASPVPCETKPLCVKKDGSPSSSCVSCAEFLANSDFERAGDLVYFDGTRGREWIDPKTCYFVYGPGDTRTRNKRYQNDGSVCEIGCSKDPKPCSPPPPASPAPETSPSPGGSPQPQATPGTCPALVRWGGGLHAQMTPTFQGLPKEPTFAGNTIDLDSTARFGGNAGGRGLPCNDEHHAVCEASGDDHGPNWRRCEDPRGPIFTVLAGGYRKAKVINGGWGLRLEDIQAGTIRVRICPREDVQDAEGEPVRVLGDACTIAEIPVQ